MTANRHKGTFWSDGNVLKVNCGDDYTSINLLENNWILHRSRWILPYVNCTVTKLSQANNAAVSYTLHSPLSWKHTFRTTLCYSPWRRDDASPDQGYSHHPSARSNLFPTPFVSPKFPPSCFLSPQSVTDMALRSPPNSQPAPLGLPSPGQ